MSKSFSSSAAWRAVVVAVVAAGTTGVVSAQLIEPHTANERTLVEDVSRRMSSCLTTLGAKRQFPLAATRPPQGELLAAVLLHASGPAVSDGYHYTLLLHGPTMTIFIVQTGGFAGLPTVFGPLPLDTHCD